MFSMLSSFSYSFKKIRWQIIPIKQSLYSQLYRKNRISLPLVQLNRMTTANKTCDNIIFWSKILTKNISPHPVCCLFVCLSRFAAFALISMISFTQTWFWQCRDESESQSILYFFLENKYHSKYFRLWRDWNFRDVIFLFFTLFVRT